MDSHPQSGDEQQEPGGDAACTRLPGIATDADAMRHFCTDIWNKGEIKALQLVRTESSYAACLCTILRCNCDARLKLLAAITRYRERLYHSAPWAAFLIIRAGRCFLLVQSFENRLSEAE